MILLSSIFVLVTMLVPAEPTSPEDLASQVPGTYDVIFCKNSCSFESPKSVLVRGSLVLESKPFEESEIPERARKNFESGYSLASFTNGCFVLEILEEGQTYAGLIPIGFTRWWLHSGIVSFGLYSSPDAGYSASVTLTDAGFSGSGVSDGEGAADVDWPPDILIGRRRGPADRSVCINGAEKIQDK